MPNMATVLPKHAFWPQLLALGLELTAIAAFILAADWSERLHTTGVVGCGLALLLVTADAALLLTVANPLLERFLRWVLYFQIVAPLALIYGMLVAVRGAGDEFGIYFLVCLLGLPALRFVMLCITGIVEFVVNDE